MVTWARQGIGDKLDEGWTSARVDTKMFDTRLAMTFFAQEPTTAFFCERETDWLDDRYQVSPHAYPSSLLLTVSQRAATDSHWVMDAKLVMTSESKVQVKIQVWLDS